MKKIIVIFGILVSVSARASTMCAVNDTVAVVLDPSIKSTSSGANATTKTWWAQFPYGRIYGISACIDTKHGKSTAGTVSKLTDSNGDRVVGGENNGAYCWCKITHPVSSLWGFHSDRGAYCNATCLSQCAGSSWLYASITQ